MSELSSDPESYPSFQTESESEHDSTWGEDKEQKEVDYTATAKDIICEDVNITTENALKLNSGYHNMLKVLRNKLEVLLAHCQERQIEIEKQIDDYRNNRKPLTGKSRTSGYICGQPFFKDEDLYPGPHNEDYLYRKNALKEFFPLDLFEVTDTNWTVKDKVNILKGVKQQIIEFIDVENRLKIKKIGNGLEAERLRREIVSLKGIEITDLWEKVKNFPKEYPDRKFAIDWLRISNVNISGRHSVEACIGIWNNYMLPGLIRDAWKAEEERQLLEAVESHERQDWAAIASYVPGRSPYQCFVHYQTTFSELAQIKHAKWTDEEDALLVKLVDENRIGTNIVWNKVVEKMPLRNKIQCYNRYMFTLMRPTKKAKFTPEEDCIIIAYVQQYGDDFRFVQPNLLPGRTNRQIWARYNQTLKYVNKHSGWTIEDDMRLMNFIKENLTDEGPRKISWAACSKVLGNHSRLSCRTRYYTIEKFLEKFPDATLDDVPRKDKKLSSSVTNENWVKTIIDIRNDPVSGEAEMADAQEQPSSSGTNKQNKVPKFTTVKKKTHFFNSLKCIFKKHLYEKMKYSFHYKMNDQSPPVDNQRVFSNNKAIFMLLNCPATVKNLDSYLERVTAEEALMIRRSLTVELNPGLEFFLRRAMYCFLFPPNYNTLLGLRGVVLNATYPEESVVKSKEDVACEENDTEYQNALETFKDRFRMLFTWTMLLVAQNPRDADFKTERLSNEQESSSITFTLPIQQLELTNDRIEKQVSLEQLSKLYNSPRLSRNKKRTKVLAEETTVCLDQLNLANRPFDINSSPTASLPISQISLQEKLHEASSSNIDVLHQSELQSNLQHASTEMNTAYQLQLAFLVGHPSDYDSQPHATSVTNKESLTAVDRVTFSTCSPVIVQPVIQSTDQCLQSVTTPAENLDLVAQITVIDPDNLPPAVPPPSSFSFAVTELHDSRDECRENPSLLPQNFEQRECTESLPIKTDCADGETCRSDEHDDFQENDDHDQQLSQEQQPHSPLPHDEVENDNIDDDNADISLSETCSVVSARSSANMLQSRVTHVTNIGDYVIEELNATPTGGYCDEPNLFKNSLRRSQSLDFEEPLDLHVSKATNISETNFSSVASKEVKAECSMNLSFPSSSVDQLDFIVEPALIEVPKKTYSRVGKLKLLNPTIISTERWWRWTHLNDANEEEIELHQELWEKSDPIRLRFQPTQCDEEFQNNNEIIVIDDDDVIIKEEPPEVEAQEETENMMENFETPPVDDDCLQEVIQRANNILRITEAYKQSVQNMDNATCRENSSQDTIVYADCNTMDHTNSLIVQTPSQIFDEESNCFYYVDEINEDVEHDYNVPVVEIPQMSIEYPPHSTLEDIVRYSLQRTYPTMPQFQSPRPSPSSPQDIENEISRNFVPQAPMHTSDSSATPVTRNNRAFLSKAKKAEQHIQDGPSTSVPRIRPPKRPPRDQVKPTQATDKVKALSLLNDLYKRPRLPPSKNSLSVSTDENLKTAKDGSIVTAKRRLPPRRLSRELNVKKGKLNNSYKSQRVRKTVDAVDIIEALNNMRERMNLEDDSDEDDFSFSEEQKVQVVQQPEARTIAPMQLSDQTTKTATHQKINTIIQSTSGRPGMDVLFRVGNITIKKIAPQ
ncbi:uncharacterized protein LOC129732092 [Wyeomyia smithii]|uniref:uncharacterized protein LOC129732092 n=1 Tax=Wyeomyia smithii TaxID=174621 RepID=UPI002467DDCD|nr:uncharacterized protein LOC129732092 [Wyeomyia smithii]